MSEATQSEAVSISCVETRLIVEPPVQEVFAARPGQAHKLVMGLFADGLGHNPRQRLRVLYRHEGHVVTVRSAERPVFPLRGGIIESCYTAELVVAPQQVLNLAVRLSPQTNTHSPPQFIPAEIARRSEHEPVSRPARLKWAMVKLSKAGLIFVSPPDSGTADLRAKNNEPLPIVDVKGEAVVTDQEAFRQAYLEGVGRGRSFGCGMLQVVREVQSEGKWASSPLKPQVKK